MKHSRLPTSKLVLLAAAGFSSGAQRKALSLGIETVSLDEVENEEWAWLGSGKLAVWALRIRGCNLGFEAEKVWFPAPSNTAIFRPDGTYRGRLGDVVRSHLAGSADFSEAAIEHAERSGQSEFWGECESEPPFAVKDTRGRLHIATSVHVRVQAVKSPGVVALTKGRLKNSVVAFGRGQSPAGELTLSLFRSGDTPCAGAVSVADPASGRVHTVDVDFTPLRRKLRFVAGPVRMRDDPVRPNKRLQPTKVRRQPPRTKRDK